MTKSEIMNEIFQIRGELQNGSITGINADEQALMLKYVNREIKDISDMHPPFLQTTFHLHYQNSVALQTTGSTDSATGTTNIPQLIDSNSTLSKRHKFWTVSDGTSRRRIIGVTGTTYTIANGLFTQATTGQSWVAYKDVYPVPHNCGHIHNIFYEDGEIEVSLIPRATYECISRVWTSGAEPRQCSFNAFSDRWGNQKSSESSTTVANGSNLVLVSDNTLYDIGDVMSFTSGTTDHLHTCTGLSATSTTHIYIDRDYGGTSGRATLKNNPQEHTDYLSFYYIPTTAKDVLIVGYIKPHDLVNDADICIIPDYLCPAVIVGALLKDKIGKGILTEQHVAWYNSTIDKLRQKKDAVVFKGNLPPGGLFNRTYQASEFDFSGTGVSV